MAAFVTSCSLDVMGTTPLPREIKIPLAKEQNLDRFSDYPPRTPPNHRRTTENTSSRTPTLTPFILIRRHAPETLLIIVRA